MTPRDRGAPRPRPVRIRAVLFDLGGTLVDNRHFGDWAEAVKVYGLEIEPDELAHAYTVLLLAMEEGPPISEAEFWRQILERSARRPVSLATAERLCAAERDRARPAPLFSDARRCLDDLRAQRRRLGIVSNSRGEESVRQILAAAGVEDYFETIVSSGTEGIAKPDPAIFHRALERMGVAPDESFYVGDLPRTDAKGAAAAGLHSVWLHRDGTGFGTDPPEITSLLEVPLLVRRLERGEP